VNLKPELDISYPKTCLQKIWIWYP